MTIDKPDTAPSPAVLEADQDSPEPAGNGTAAADRADAPTAADTPAGADTDTPTGADAAPGAETAEPSEQTP